MSSYAPALAASTALLSIGLAAACSAAAPSDETSSEALTSNVQVLTSKNDANRTGANPNERLLTTSSVSGASFGKVFSRMVDGAIFAQPLYVGGVDGKNVVYVATEHNSVYAFDADDLRADAAPLWQRNFGPSLPASDTGCSLLTPEIGITSTPVIDAASKTMWFTTRHKEGGRYAHRLNAVDIATGRPRPNSPVEITARVRGNGTTSQGGIITFDPLMQMQRPGLLKVQNRIYIAFASQCDIQPYHGWVLGYDATTLAQTGAHITTPNGGEGGIWQGGVGIAADANGDIYYTAGDAYDTSGQRPWNGAGNLADSLVRLHDDGASMRVVTSFTPSDAPTWSPRDLSIGSTGGILVPGTNLFVSGDKRGQIYVVDRDDMGGTAPGDAQIVQKFQGAVNGIWGGAAYYKVGGGGIYYVWGNGDRLKAYRFNGSKLDLPARVNANTLVGYPGGQLSISSNGEVAGSAIVWTVRSKRTGTGLASSAGAGVLQAFDAMDITRELWSSEGRAADALGNVSKFAPPTIANGRVFVGGAANQLVVYGLLHGTVTPPPDAGTHDTGAGSDAGPLDAPTWTQIYDRYFGPSTPGHCSNTRCHATERAGFKCGLTKAECYAGLVNAGLVTPARPKASPIAIENESPLVWLGGGMPLDDASENDEAAAAIKAWVAAGARND